MFIQEIRFKYKICLGSKMYTEMYLCRINVQNTYARTVYNTIRVYSKCIVVSQQDHLNCIRPHIDKYLPILGQYKNC